MLAAKHTTNIFVDLRGLFHRFRHSACIRSHSGSSSFGWLGENSYQTGSMGDTQEDPEWDLLRELDKGIFRGAAADGPSEAAAGLVAPAVLPALLPPVDMGSWCPPSGQGFNQMPVAPQMPTIPKAVLAFSADGSQAYLYAQAPLWLARHILV